MGEGTVMKRLNEELFKAIAAKNAARVSSWIKLGADVNASDKHYRIPLLEAVSSGNPETVKVLLDAGANVNVSMCRYGYGRTPLHEAAEFSKPEIVEILLKAGADVNARDRNGYTPLRLTSRFGHPADADTARILIKAGADVNARENWGRYPFAYGCEFWQVRNCQDPH